MRDHSGQGLYKHMPPSFRVFFVSPCTLLTCGSGTDCTFDREESHLLDCHFKKKKRIRSLTFSSCVVILLCPAFCLPGMRPGRLSEDRVGQKCGGVVHGGARWESFGWPGCATVVGLRSLCGPSAVSGLPFRVRWQDLIADLGVSVSVSRSLRISQVLFLTTMMKTLFLCAV